MDPLSTPQKNANKKKQKGTGGEAVDSSDGVEISDGSAASPEEDRWAQ
jgi:hypothetical protein